MSHGPAGGVEPQPLYAARIPIFPRRVHGWFRNLKWWILAVTLGIYYITPWIRWDRGPNLPDQAVLVDLANRRFYFFWIEIWPQEFYYVAGLLIMAGLGLFLFTSALGRVWCGYTCPQTVWTDLFILVERWIEGDRNARIRLLRQKWDGRKTRLRLTKWTVWALIGLATGGAWVFYFADAPTLAHDLVTGAAHPVAYISVALLTATTFTFGGFMREQICIYMCPWPRIQAAMMDENTLTVSYREWRGEPRGKKHENTTGDCIDCMGCVNVCPMGIDIRNGQQLECITCALCVDACDEVMDRIGKPRGLIDYVTLADDEAAAKGAPTPPVWTRIVRPRTLLYTTLWAGIGVAMVVTLALRSSVDLTVAHDRNPLFVTLSSGAIRNGYTVKIANRHGDTRRYVLGVQSALPLDLQVQGEDGRLIEVGPDQIREIRVFVSAEPGAGVTGDVPMEVWVAEQDSPARARTMSFFKGPDA
ncbi:cytochrome c oxidase accessory protein CcoG [Paroceanicella profunda]|uniref:Cytochrome c oxidase accessory protein CcoG n=1 Tax=Paroceanicella profunda TaxID=2579971 RepID=A0A5B8G0Q0_9RHOB|nr:cytochrome c oxidase accessory protein CcoG [Paroceanicella profunda]QDL92699.1 cytochrome c oxidase accessory protein CcoG [Paroceanicella profunda]